MIADLLHSSLFAGLSLAEIQQVLDEVNLKEETFEKGQILAFENEVCNRLIILLKGSVEAQMTDPMGKVVKVEDISAPNPIAVLFLFGDKNRFPVQVSARELTQTLIIPKQSVLKMLGLNLQILKNYLDLSANYASVLTRKLHFISFRTIRQKLALYLLDLLPDGQSTIQMDRSQNALAEYFGVTRPALRRELGKMEEEGLIEMGKKEIKVLNKSDLIRLVRFQ